MAYNPQLYYPQNYQPYQYQPQMPMQTQQIQAPAPQMQTRIIEVVPVDTEEAAESFPVAVGATQVMFAKDDSFVAVKTVGVNGLTEFNVFSKRPKPVKKETLDLSDYVTKEELNERLRALQSLTRDDRKEDEE